MKYDIVASGELMMDFIPGLTASGEECYIPHAGGSPANIIVQAAVLGAKTAFLSKVGDDLFGNKLLDTMNQYGVDTEGLILSSKVNTTLSFLLLTRNGKHAAHLVQRRGPVTQMTANDIHPEIIRSSKILHFSSLALSGEPGRTTALESIHMARKAGSLISFDPGYRSSAWEDADTARNMLRKAAFLADIVKFNEAEMFVMTGKAEAAYGGAALLETGAKIVFITLGERGCYYATRLFTGYVKSYKVNVVDATSAGDAFMGAILYRISQSEKSPETLAQGEIEDDIRFAQAAAAHNITRFGGINAMGNQAQIRQIMRMLG